MKAGALGFLFIATVLAGAGIAGTAAAEPIHICVDIDAVLGLDWLIDVEAVVGALLSNPDIVEMMQFIYQYAVDLTQDLLSQVVFCAFDLPVDLPQLPPFPLP